MALLISPDFYLNRRHPGGLHRVQGVVFPPFQFNPEPAKRGFIVRMADRLRALRSTLAPQSDPIEQLPQISAALWPLDFRRVLSEPGVSFSAGLAGPVRRVIADF